MSSAKSRCARRLHDAEAAIAAANTAGIQLGIGHERRFEPAFIDLRRRFASGEFGRPLLLEGNFSQDKFLKLPGDNWRLSDATNPVGPLSATGIHLVDLSIALLGRPVSVWARLARLGSDFANGDTLSMTIGFEGGATASLGAVLVTPFMGRLALLGSKGWMEIRDRSHPENSTGWDVTSAHRDQTSMTTFLSAASGGPGQSGGLRPRRAWASALPGLAGRDADECPML